MQQGLDFTTSQYVRWRIIKKHCITKVENFYCQIIREAHPVACPMCNVILAFVLRDKESVLIIKILYLQCFGYHPSYTRASTMLTLTNDILAYSTSCCSHDAYIHEPIFPSRQLVIHQWLITYCLLFTPANRPVKFRQLNNSASHIRPLHWVVTSEIP